MRVLQMALMQSCLLAALTVGGTASAQNVLPAEMSGQPLQYMKDGSVDGCGLRIMAFRPLASGRIEAVETSVNIYVSGGAFIKAVAYRPGTAEQFAKELQPVKVTGAWIRAEGQKATPTLTKKIVGDDKKSLLYGTDFSAALNVLKAQMEGTRVQLSVRRQGEPSDWILSGVVKLSDTESEQFLGCMREFVDSMRGSADADDEVKPPVL